jgi:Localisation of periplasmic protein complexes.
VCAAALLCSRAPARRCSRRSIATPAAAPNFPVASGARLAGDSNQTRFVLDLDKTIQFSAFALADPYRVVVDLPQVSFQLAAGTGTAGRGLIKAFRYGLVMPGGSRIVFDLTGPAKIANSYVLDAANGQPPRLVLELEQVDRTSFVQALTAASRPELRPAIADAAEPPPLKGPRRPERPSRLRPRICVPWSSSIPAMAASTMALRPVAKAKRAWFWGLGWRCAIAWKKAANTASS